MTKTYKGKEVQKIIDIILEEADASIEKAYKEGYKQATVELLPQVEYWQELYTDQKKIYKKQRLKNTLISFGSGLILGSGITIFATVTF